MGTHHKGREAIESCHAPLFEKYQRGSRIDGEITQVRLLTPDVALVHGKGALVKGRQRRTARNTKMQTWLPCGATESGRSLPSATRNTTG